MADGATGGWSWGLPRDSVGLSQNLLSSLLMGTLWGVHMGGSHGLPMLLWGSSVASHVTSGREFQGTPFSPTNFVDAAQKAPSLVPAFAPFGTSHKEVHRRRVHSSNGDDSQHKFTAEVSAWWTDHPPTTQWLSEFMCILG